MAATAKRKLVIPVLAILLAFSVVVNIRLYPAATRSLFEARDQPLIDRTITLASREYQNAEGLREQTFPIVYRRAGPPRSGRLTCVELRWRHGLGHFGACYDIAGKIVEETSSVSHPSLGVRERIEAALTRKIGWP